MRAYSRWIYPVFLAVLLSVGSHAEETKPPETPAPAEDEGKLGWVFVEVSDWMSEGVGLDYEPSSYRDASGTAILGFPSGTENRFRYRVGYLLNRNIGEVIATWFSHDQERDMSRYSPGVFAYGELPIYPLFAGVNDDGLADGFEAGARTKSRDLRIDFQRIGYESSRITFRWLVGYRSIEHERSLNGSYYSIFPVYLGDPLPPFLWPQQVSDPNPLAPTPDVVATSSTFSGHGPEAGAEVTFPLNRHLYIETGFSFAVLSGDLETRYSSTTHFYALMVPPTNLEIDHVMVPPFDEFDTVPSLSMVQQFNVATAVSSDTPVTSQVLEAYLGIRWKAWRGLEAFAGFRGSRYTDIGADIRPSQVSWLRDPATGRIATTVANVDRTDHAANYEGLYLGVSYKF